MPPTLPSPIRRILTHLCGVAMAIAGCHHPDAPVAPGPPIVADPVPDLGAMDAECDAMMAALAAWGTCAHADDGDRAESAGWLEVARDAFEAGKKGHLDDKSQRVVAAACHKARDSVLAAKQRCDAGPRPKGDY